MDRPLRLVVSNPVDELARTIEALLVVASAPLGERELADATADDPERVREALERLAERFCEGRSGIVLEHVASGWAFRASTEAADACAGLVERGLVAEAGRDREFGAVRYQTTPLFERVFGLESLAELPRVDDVGADAAEIRDRLESVAEKRPA